MPLVMIDQSTLKMHIRCEPSESFTPDEELKKLVVLTDQLFKKHMKVVDEMKKLLKKCDDWNKKHNPEYQKRVEELKEEIRQKQKK